MIVAIIILALIVAFYLTVGIGASILGTESSLMSKTRFNGKDYYDEKVAANYKECRDRCLADPKCRAWMFASPTATNYDQRNMCSLTNEKPGTYYDAQYMSGVTNRGVQL